MHFLNIWLKGIIAITNSKSDNTSHWKIPLWIFTSVKLFPPAVISTLYMVFSINLMTSPDILYILKRSIIQLIRLTYNVENTNSTNYGRDLRFDNKPWRWIMKKGIPHENEKTTENQTTLQKSHQEINIWAVPLVRYLVSFLKWTREELQQMDQTTRKLMTLPKALRPRDAFLWSFQAIARLFCLVFSPRVRLINVL